MKPFSDLIHLCPISMFIYLWCQVKQRKMFLFLFEWRTDFYQQQHREDVSPSVSFVRSSSTMYFSSCSVLWSMPRREEQTYTHTHTHTIFFLQLLRSSLLLVRPLLWTQRNGAATQSNWIFFYVIIFVLSFVRSFIHFHRRGQRHSRIGHRAGDSLNKEISNRSSALFLFDHLEVQCKLKTIHDDDIIHPICSFSSPRFD